MKCVFEGVTCNIGRSWFSRSHPPRKREWRVKSGEWSWRSFRRRDLRCWALVSIKTSSTAERSPFPYEGKALIPLRMGSRSCTLRQAKRCRPGPGCRTPCGVGWRGSALSGTPPHNFRRGQRLSTDIRHSPAPARSAELRFAVILLSKATDRESDKVRRLCWHLIHR